MSPPVQPVASNPALPPRADVVVIGGGLIGVSAAFHVTKKGVSVALCEKGLIAGEQSSRNWGWCRVMGRDPAEIPLCLESLRMWDVMNCEVGAETGFRRAGIAYVCASGRDVETHERWLAHAREYQVKIRVLDASATGEALSGAARPWVRTFFSPDDGRAEPQLAAPAIAEAARRLGASLHTSCAVRGVETEAGSVSAVITEKGRIACDAVLLAGGVWSRLFCGALGIEFPQLKVLASAMRTAPLTGPPDFAVGSPEFAFRKRFYGGYTIGPRNAYRVPIVPDSFRLFFAFLPSFVRDRRQLGLRVGRSFVDEWRTPRRWKLDAPSPFEVVRVLDPAPTDALLDRARDRLIESYPAFRDMRVVERWAGLIDVTPDAVPVISPVVALPGFFLASGFSGHGFGIGPAAGRLAADLISGDRPIVDPAPFRYERLQGGPA